ncbi:hypothetical protein FDECE_2007 [Fusarium decemcellulare]|nr:hypothetical protein FDECE_2007 [Fusarium decemcellulare]
MRLLNVHKCQLESFEGAETEIPPYAILSHTWDDVEITFQDITGLSIDELSLKPAFYKVQESCAQARQDGFDYIWIDTCCIDKTSSSELSEAINSMFKWYQQSALCYVYLSDFNSGFKPRPEDQQQDRVTQLAPDDISFCRSRWFTRGWTLQELIAPRSVDFFDKNWVSFGSRDGDLRGRVCERTRIQPELFTESRCSCRRGYPAPQVRDGICMGCGEVDALPQSLDSFAVSIKMNWASSRVTTRKEDAAYCLIGLFNINMPMLYGEGDKAFLRLQEAIVRQSKDQSILLWRGSTQEIPRERAPGCLAPSHSNFQDAVRILGRRVFSNVDRRRYETDFLGNMAPMEITDTALRTNLWICPCTVSAYDPDTDGYLDRQLWLGILDLARDNDHLVRPAIILEHMGAVDLYRRVYHQLIITVNPRQEHVSFRLSLEQNGDSVVDPRAEVLADRSTIAIERSLSGAFKKDVGILLQQSPINAVRTNPFLEQGPSTGPVYLVDNTQKLHCTIDSGGSHPAFSSYNLSAKLIPSPWTFNKCHHVGVDRYFGGIHFVNFTVDDTHSVYFYPGTPQEVNKQRGYVAIIWGLHRVSAGESGRVPPWKLWCRVFNMHDFIKSARTSQEDLRPSQLYHEDEALSPGEIQRRMENQRGRLCLESFERFWIPQKTGPKPLFPDTCEDHWSEDSMTDILNDETIDTRLSASVAMVEGLGRTLFELRITIDQVVKQ